MTMVLGFNLGDVAFISGDTRATYKEGMKTYSDNLQKIDLIKTKNTVIAAAGGACSAAELVAAFSSNRLTVPGEKEIIILEVREIALDVKRRIEKLDKFPQNPLPPVILLFQYLEEDRVNMTVYRIQFIKDGEINPQVQIYPVKPNQFVKIGKTGDAEPVVVEEIPKDYVPVLKPPMLDGMPYEAYLAVTDAIFDVALSAGELSVGGKTTTLATFRLDDGRFASTGIKGFRSIVHSEDSYQDVSGYTDFNADRGLFLLRDLRREGRNQTHIIKEGDGYKFYYDSCPRNIGVEDSYYELFSARRIGEKSTTKELSLEL